MAALYVELGNPVRPYDSASEMACAYDSFRSIQFSPHLHLDTVPPVLPQDPRKLFLILPDRPKIGAMPESRTH
jgi:hypothetical protein